jgi:hypothetical protein
MGTTHFSGPVYSEAGFLVGGDSAPYQTVSSTATGLATASITGTINPTPTFGSSTALDPSSAQGLKGQVYATAQTSTATYYIGVMGRYLVYGANASTFPKVGVLGVIGDSTTTADAAVMAFIDGDGGTTTARAGFGIAMTNSTGASGFTYGLDLKMQDPVGGGGSIKAYKIAEIRLANDSVGTLPVVIKVGNFADGTASGVGKGSLGLDSTDGLLFIADINGDWQQVTV